MLKIVKNDGTLQEFDAQKILRAIGKSAERILYSLSTHQQNEVVKYVYENIVNEVTKVRDIHSLVEQALDYNAPEVAKSYKDFRNYKENEHNMMKHMHEFAEQLQFLGDKENANTDSALVSTQRSLVYGELRSEEYKKYFLNIEERQAMNDGFIYIHDRSARLDAVNCCLFDLENILKGGFEMANIWYNEPASLDVAFDVISDVILSSAAMQYGGHTTSEIDKILAPYAKKSYHSYINELQFEYEFLNSKLADYGDMMRIAELAMRKVKRDFDKGFQGLEYKFNTVGSSRGDYPFVAMSFGLGTDKFAKMATSSALEVRKNGQGKKGLKRPVLFPKYTFLYDEELHGVDKKNEDIFLEAIDCSSKCMYPDFLSLSGKGYIPSIYQKYDKAISLMGCRASLSPWYERGGIKPADENDSPNFIGRFNLGAISLHLPMILREAQVKNGENFNDSHFYDELVKYMQIARKLHQKTFNFLANKKASTNPLGFCQGGFYNGYLDPNKRIGEDFLRPMTMSFGITALNELQMLYNGKSLIEDGDFAEDVMKFINQKINEWKEEDNILYAVYGTPAEGLAGKQIKQFRKKFGIIEGVSNREYVSNSFHCGVWEDITPIQKQDYEERFWNYFNGGKITYNKYPINYNKEAIISLVRRGMEKGFYLGVNMDLAYCGSCGYEELAMEKCPKCGSDDITQINRMNGYLGYSKVKGKTRYNDAKMAEIKDRISM